MRSCCRIPCHQVYSKKIHDDQFNDKPNLPYAAQRHIITSYAGRITWLKRVESFDDISLEFLHPNNLQGLLRNTHPYLDI